jgi:hypothetical protein
VSIQLVGIDVLYYTYMYIHCLYLDVTIVRKGFEKVVMYGYQPRDRTVTAAEAYP